MDWSLPMACDRTGSAYDASDTFGLGSGNDCNAPLPSFCCHDLVAGIDPHATFDEVALAGSSSRRMYEQDSSDALLGG